MLISWGCYFSGLYLAFENIFSRMVTDIGVGSHSASPHFFDKEIGPPVNHKIVPTVLRALFYSCRSIMMDKSFKSCRPTEPDSILSMEYSVVKFIFSMLDSATTMVADGPLKNSKFNCLDQCVRCVAYFFKTQYFLPLAAIWQISSGSCSRRTRYFQSS